MNKWVEEVFLYNKLLNNKWTRNDRLERSPFEIIIVIFYSAKDYQKMLSLILEYLSSTYIFVTKGKKIILCWRNLTDTSLINKSKLMFPVMGQSEIVYYLIGCNKKKTTLVLQYS